MLFDLKSCYHRMDMQKCILNIHYCNFFMGNIDGTGRLFVYCSIFIKIIRHLVKYSRCKGALVVVFHNDVWIRSPYISDCECIPKSFIYLWSSESGMGTKGWETVWTPTQKIAWLCLNWDANSGTIQAIDRRIEFLLSGIQSLNERLPFATRGT